LTVAQAALGRLGYRRPAMEALWFFLSVPARLMPVLWPVFTVPLMLGAFALVLRPVVLRGVEPERLSRVMRSSFAWPLAVVVGTFVLLWLTVSLGFFVLILAAQAGQT
jgi:hypothetical protein